MITTKDAIWGNVYWVIPVFGALCFMAPHPAIAYGAVLITAALIAGGQTWQYRNYKKLGASNQTAVIRTVGYCSLMAGGFFAGAGFVDAMLLMLSGVFIGMWSAGQLAKELSKTK